jgi:hypothetical protein
MSTPFAAPALPRWLSRRNVSLRHLGSVRRDEMPSSDSASFGAPGNLSRKLKAHGIRAAHGAQRGSVAISRSLRASPCARCRW